MSSIVSALTGGVAGVAIGEAGSSALEPVFELPKQDAWSKNQNRILSETQLAQLVAQAINAVSDVVDDVHRNGFDSDQLEALVQLALRAPGPPDAEKLYLRLQGNYPGAITLDQLHHAYGKAQIEGQYWGALTAAAQNQLLTPAELALAVVRSTVQDSGLLVVKLDTSDSNVPQYPVAALDTLAEFAAAGVNAERARVLVGAIGLPMSTQQAASAYFRDIITEGGFNQSILEGDVRPEWAPYILEQARQIATVREYIENYLRGWTPDFNTALANAAKHGMSAADATVIYQNMGRPLAIHQITTGLARGGTFGGFYQDVPEPYLSSVRESNIRPDYGNLAYANRYTYPSGFQIKAEATAGVLDEATTEMLLLQVGWSPEWAAFFAKAWAAPAASTSSPVKSAQTKLRTAAEKAYLGGASSVTEATSDLEAAGVTATDIPLILAAWDQIKAIEARTTPPAAPIVAPPSGG